MLYERILKLSVTEGPSKMDLITALAYAFDKRNSFYVEFKTRLVDPENEEQQQLSRCLYGCAYGHLVVRIQSIEHEDRSGVSFNFSGSIMAEHPRRRARTATHGVKGYYSVSERKGTLSIKITTCDGK